MTRGDRPINKQDLIVVKNYEIEPGITYTGEMKVVMRFVNGVSNSPSNTEFGSPGRNIECLSSVSGTCERGQVQHG